MASMPDTRNRSDQRICQSGTVRRFAFVAVAAMSCLLSLSGQAKAENPADSQSDGSKRMTELHTLGLSELPGSMPAC